MNLIEIFTILIVHWISDFCLQTDKMAKGKSNNMFDLLDHTVTYSVLWIIPIWLLFKYNDRTCITSHNVPIFIGITFIFHTITDFITSRINSRLWKEGKIHGFFISIGFDQLLHYSQLFITYQLLK